MADASLQVELRAKDEATQAVKNLGVEGDKTSKSLKSGLIPALLKTAIVLEGLKLAARTVGGLIKSLTTGFIDSGDEMIKTARAFGVSVEQLSTLRAEAALASVDFHAMLMSTRKLAQGVDDLRRGTGESIDSWRYFGITIEDIDKSGGSLTDVMELLADRVSQLPDSLAKANAAGDIFGQRVGSKLIPLLDQGSEALRKQKERFIELGVIMSQDQARAAEKAADAMTLLRLTAEGVRNEIGAQVAPVLEDLILRFLAFFQEVRPKLVIFLHAVPLTFRAVFMTVRKIIQEGFGGELFSELLAKFGLLGAGILKITARFALTMWEPLFTEFKIIGYRIVNFWADQVGNKLVEDLANLPQNLARVLPKGLRDLLGLSGFARSTVRVKLFPTLDESELTSLATKMRAETTSIGEGFRKAGAEAVAQFSVLFDKLKTTDASFPQLKRVFVGVAAALKQAQREAEKFNKEADPTGKPTITAWQRFLGLDEKGDIQADQGFLGALQKIKADLDDVGMRGVKVGQDLAAALTSALDNGFFKVIEGGFESTRRLFKDLLADILKGLAQIAARQVTSSIVSNAIGLLPGLAKGGVVPGELLRTVPVQAYQHGGIATSPQLALFGEGSSPGEAFVPLGPNRKIPVELDGKGATPGRTTNLTLNVQAIDAASFATFLDRPSNRALLKNLLVDEVNIDDGFRRTLNRRR